MKVNKKDKVLFDFFYENKIGIVKNIIGDKVEILGFSNILYTVKLEKILKIMKDEKLD